MRADHWAEKLVLMTVDCWVGKLEMMWADMMVALWADWKVAVRVALTVGM